MDDLANQECLPCKGGIPPLKGEKLQGLLEKLGNGWQVIQEHHLEKEFRFKNFREALSFVNVVGALAESVNHHPDLVLAWGLVKVTLWTHKISGLTESDFFFAAKTERLFHQKKP
jgi:4a-hydroxytetrahydrobiopterin dehydratase